MLLKKKQRIQELEQSRTQILAPKYKINNDISTQIHQCSKKSKRFKK